jgi:FAD/FMN-containing dehydrogenase
MSTRTMPIDETKIIALRGRLRGPLLLEASDRDAFAESCRIWNGMIRSRPALVVRPTGSADIVECVRFAREHRLLIAAKGGGHNIAGTSLAADGLTVDLCRMRGVLVDPVHKLARVQGGCLLGDVDRETQLHGLATVLGFVSETGVAGLTLGGGFGYLTRRFGWASDNLVEVEIVTADARVLRASAQENPDLFWALRGGGANFGIVTSFTFRLHEVGPSVTAGMIAWPAEQAPEVLATFAEVSATAGRELTLATNLRLAPPAPFLPKDFHGKPMIGVIACHTGTPAQAERDLEPLRRCGKPIADQLVQKPYAAQQMMLDATQPKGLHYYWKSEYLPGLSAAARETFLKYGARIPTAQSQIILFQVGGALGERPADDGAVGNRDAQFVFSAAGCWLPDDPNAQAHPHWVRDAWQAMKPHATGGVYVNFLTEEEGEDRVRAAYGANFARLSAVKGQYDPDNLFRSNKNVLPQR